MFRSFQILTSGASGHDLAGRGRFSSMCLLNIERLRAMVQGSWILVLLKRWLVASLSQGNTSGRLRLCLASLLGSELP